MEDEHPELVDAITLFFELPWDVQLHLVHTWTYEKRPPWKGWDRASMAAYIGVPAPLPEGLRPQYRVAFRGTATREPNRSKAIEAAFSDALSPAQHRITRVARRVALWVNLKYGMPRHRTVAGVTHWSSEEDTPAEAGHQAHEDFLALNDFLTAFGLVSDDTLIGSLSLAQLPALMPAIGVLPVIDGWASRRTILQTGLWRRELLRLPRDPEDLRRAEHMFTIGHRADDPTFRVVALLHGAWRDLLAGRLVRAVMFSGIAVELLVDSTLRRGWAPAAQDPLRLPRVLQAGFKNQIQDHIGKILATAPLDVTAVGTEIGDWWAQGYALRNDIVHSGKRPSYQAVYVAIETAFELAAFFGRRLEANPATQHLRGMLPTRKVSPRRYAAFNPRQG